MDRFSHAIPLPQVFPFNMMNYITKNPPRRFETQLKLLKTCKYFFSKQPILPVVNVTWTFDKHIYFCYPFGIEKSKAVSIDVSKLDCKLWIIGACNISGHVRSYVGNDLLYNDPKVLSFLLSKTYCCNFSQLFLNDLIITSSEWSRLIKGGGVRTVRVERFIIEKDDGSIMPIEEILAALPKNIKHFYFDSSIGYTPETSKKLSEIPVLSCLSSFILLSINEVFDPNYIISFLIKQRYPKCQFEFGSLYPQEEYNRFLEAITEFKKTLPKGIADEDIICLKHQQ